MYWKLWSNLISVLDDDIFLVLGEECKLTLIVTMTSRLVTICSAVRSAMPLD